MSQHFITRLELDQLDRDIFTGQCHSGAPLRAYGGQIAAQSLMAAGRTVDDPDRKVHSLHGYFLRPGQTKDSMVYLVDRLRDGRSFSTRTVRAVQHGETIFFMTASFAVEDSGPVHQFERPPAPEPTEIPELDMAAMLAIDPGSLSESDYPERALIDFRVVHRDQPVVLRDGRFERMAWVRITENLPSDPLVQACALTYLSDLTMVTTALSPHLGSIGQLQLASIDHAVWFHTHIDTEQWLLFALDTPVANAGHGLARGLFFDRGGVLIASVVQESLMRARQPH